MTDTAEARMCSFGMRIASAMCARHPQAVLNVTVSLINPLLRTVLSAGQYNRNPTIIRSAQRHDNIF
jgi:hypothetical protein